MGGWLDPVFWVINELLEIFKWVIFIRVILSWLLAFGVFNMRNQLVHSLDDICRRLTDPLMRPIQRVLPPIGGLDLSPLVLLLIVFVAQAYLTKIRIALL